MAVNEGVSDFLSRSSRSRVTVNGGEMSDFSSGLSHSLCSRVAVNGGEMMWPFSLLMLLQGGG